MPGQDLSTAGSQLLQNSFGLQQRETTSLEDFLADCYLKGGDGYSMDNFSSSAPGSVWNYSNIATSLAAYLVEAATETPFKEYVHTHILQPLGMNNTTYDLSKVNQRYLAKLYWDKNIPLSAYENDSYPDAGLKTNNADLTKFLMDMMKGAKGQSNSLFSKENYSLLFSELLPYGIVPSVVGENNGIFWFLGNGDIKHSGCDPGTTCDLQFDKTGAAGYLLLTNMDASTDEHEAAWRELETKIKNAIEEFINAS